MATGVKLVSGDAVASTVTTWKGVGEGGEVGVFVTVGVSVYSGGSVGALKAASVGAAVPTSTTGGSVERNPPNAEQLCRKMPVSRKIEILWHIAESMAERRAWVKKTLRVKGCGYWRRSTFALSQFSCICS